MSAPKLAFLASLRHTLERWPAVTTYLTVVVATMAMMAYVDAAGASAPSLGYALANLGITGGYVFVGVWVAPHFALRHRWATCAGVVFFVTCGMTHLDMAYWAAIGTGHHGGPGALMIVNHGVQLVAVWVFVLGLYEEFVRNPDDRQEPS